MLDPKLSKKNNLLPAIIQNENSREVLMLGYMNKEAFNKTIKTGLVNFWSRSKKRLWKKGELSGNKLKVKKIFFDCDKDAILVKVKLVGNTVCHTGNKSCFYNLIRRKNL